MKTEPLSPYAKRLRAYVIQHKGLQTNSKNPRVRAAKVAQAEAWLDEFVPGWREKRKPPRAAGVTRVVLSKEDEQA